MFNIPQVLSVAILSFGLGFHVCALCIEIWRNNK